MGKMKTFIKNMSFNFELFEFARYDDVVWISLFTIEINDRCGSLFHIGYDQGYWQFDILWKEFFNENRI
jgi:hypothetical protein